MHRTILIPLAVLLIVPAAAQSLPATPPTSLANPSSLPAPIAGMPTGGNRAQHHKARVTYAGGLLQVRADNSSLNQILRDISRETGMKIVGGVPEQRIFGNYGPAQPATVLQTLLDGTRTNMLLKETSTEGPAELFLSPQTGGSSPPSPSSPSYDATESEPELPLPGQPAIMHPNAVTPQRAIPSIVQNPSTAAGASPTPSLPPVMPQPLNNVNGNPGNVSPTASTIPTVNSVPTDTLPTPSTAPPVSGIVDAPNPPPAGSTSAGYTGFTPPDNNPSVRTTTTPSPTSTTTVPTPAGYKTPQQIYQELLQLQQQKQQPSSPTTQPPATNPPSSTSPPQP
jgi:hypothetical protein